MKNHYFLFIIIFFNAASSQIVLNSFEAAEAAAMGSFGYSIDAHDNQIICTSGYPNPVPVSTAHIFEKNGSEMTQTATFEMPDATSADGYGKAVAIFGDFAAVSAPYDDEFSTDNGAVYVYHKTGNVWSLLQKVIAPNPIQTQFFGHTISIYNNQLFVFGNPNVQSSLDIYNLESNNVVFSQALSVANEINFGNLLAFEGNTFVTNYRNPGENMTQHLATYSLIGAQWTLQNEFEIESGDETGIFQIRLDNSHLYIATSSVDLYAVATISTYNHFGDGWILDTALTIDNQETNTGGNMYTDFDVSGNDMIVGMASYVSQIERKSPAIHYSKIDGVWVFRGTFYGHQTQNTDDRFGTHVRFSGDMFIINSPQDSSLNDYQGKVYFANKSVLQTTEAISRQWAVFPNPTTDKIYFQEGDAINNVEVFSVNGNLLITKENPSELSLQNLATGMYLVKLSSAEGQNQTFKIIKN